MNYLKLIPYAIVALFVVVPVWTFQAARLSKAKTELGTCLQTNQAAHEAVQKLERDARMNADTCEALVRSKERTIARLAEIDALGKEEGSHEANATGIDPVLDALNGMFRGGVQRQVR